MLYTFGDSVLDSAAYSGITAGEIVAKQLRLSLRHFARDGATSDDLEHQWSTARRTVEATRLSPSVAMVSVGGNDFLLDPLGDRVAFRSRLGRLLTRLLTGGVEAYVANVYDPTFGDDEADLLNVPSSEREAYRSAYLLLNREIAEATSRAGTTSAVLVDLHAHFLKGDRSWFTREIEPSTRGAEEVAKAFLAELVKRGQ